MVEKFKSYKNFNQLVDDGYLEVILTDQSFRG